jgi:hypothetical protein
MSTEKVRDLDGEYTRRGSGVVTVALPLALSEKVRDAAEASRCSSASKWAEQAIEFMLMEHRAGKYRPDPDRFTRRNNGEPVE